MSAGLWHHRTPDTTKGFPLPDHLVTPLEGYTVTTRDSDAYGPQTNLAIDLDPEVPRSRGKGLLTSRFVVGAAGLEPATSAL
jgi:hypothetical protein